MRLYSFVFVWQCDGVSKAALAPLPLQSFNGVTAAAAGILSPQKPVNLLPEVPNHQARKLTDRETRDVDVIGKCCFLLVIFILFIYNKFWS